MKALISLIGVLNAALLVRAADSTPAVVETPSVTVTPPSGAVQPPPVPPSAPFALQPVGVVKEVEKLAASGTDPAVVKSFIESWPTPYRVTADDILRLHDDGIASDVLTTLIRHGAEVGAQAAAAGAIPPTPQPMQPPLVTAQPPAMYEAPDYGTAPNYVEPNYAYPYPDYAAYPYSYYPYYYPYNYWWPSYGLSVFYGFPFYNHFRHFDFDHDRGRFGHGGFAGRGFVNHAGFVNHGFAGRPFASSPAFGGHSFASRPVFSRSFAARPGFVGHSGGFAGRSFAGGSFGHGGGMGRGGHR